MKINLPNPQLRPPRLLQRPTIALNVEGTSARGLRSIPRILELPKMKPQMMEAAVAREAKREMPVPLDDIYLSWQPLAASNGHQRVFALGVPRDTLDPLLRAIAVTGRRAHAVDIKPLALARAVDRRGSG